MSLNSSNQFSTLPSCLSRSLKHSKRKLLLAVGLVLFALGGCRSNPPKLDTMTVEQARELQVAFNSSEFKHLPRDIEQLRKEFGSPGPIPNDCDARRSEQRTLLESKLERALGGEDFSVPTGNFARNGAVLALISSIRHAEITGRYERALGIIDAGVRVAPSTAERYEGSRAILLAKKARLLASTGRIEAAKGAMESFVSEAQGITIDGSIPWLEGATGQVFLHTGQAAIAFAQGILPVAERHLRQASKNLDSNTYPQRYVHLHEVNSELVKILLHQGRLIEAEAHARDSIRKLYLAGALERANWQRAENTAKKKLFQIPQYNGLNAGPVAMLASVLLEQDRLDDALYLAEVAVNMHEVGCSEPTSLGFNRARSILISVLAQHGRWKDVLLQIEHARKELTGHHSLFASIYGTSLDRAEAELIVGDVEKGQSLLDEQIRERNKAGRGASTMTYEIAILHGLRALALRRQGKRDEALVMFSSILQALLEESQAVTRSIALDRRKKRILSEYMAELHNHVERGIALHHGVDLREELLRLAIALQIGNVQKALSLSRVRETVRDPELSGLIRQQQDLEEEAVSLSETLAYLQFSPDAVTAQLNLDALENRLHVVTQAGQTLKNAILTRFPKYAELVNPTPMTVAEISRLLSAHQLLVVVHVMENQSYVWSVSHQGHLTFDVVDRGEKSLKRVVAGLRRSLDPEQVSQIGDIPDFDLKTAYDLYHDLLRPLKPAWSGVNELLVVVDSPLNQIPFAILPTTATTPAKNRTLLFSEYLEVSWLIREVAVVHLPSVNTLRELSTAGTATTQDGRRPFVGFGDPHFSLAQTSSSASVVPATRGSGLLRSAPSTRSMESADLTSLPPLPDTREEILSIAKALGADPTTDVFFGLDASEKTVKSKDLSRYAVISFATHGLVPGNLNGLNKPALALTNPQLIQDQGDGLLTPDEIQALHLNVDLAVLSACNTAAGDGEGAEALSGLGKAFFYAGARSLLVSNWPVHSESTTRLMSDFFKTLRAASNTTRAQALRHTQITMIDELKFVLDGVEAFSYAHPIFWAPFTLVGDGGHSRSH